MRVDMATAIPTNSVWAAMSYVPPKGRCNHKSSLISPACPCLRFMLHPVKAATSFECDGCQHHASFHSLENKDEDAILKRWEEQQLRQQEQDALLQQAAAGANRKRKRIAEKPHDQLRMPGVFEVVDMTENTGDGPEEQLQQELAGTKSKKLRKPRLGS